MRALSLTLAMLLVQGCAPVTLGSTTSALVSSGDTAPNADDCVARDFCGSTGGSGAATIPILIVLGALTVPAFLQQYVFRSDPKRPPSVPRTRPAGAD